MQRFTHAGVAVGPPVLIATTSPTEFLDPNAGIDALDNVYVAWTIYESPVGAVGPVHARAYDASDQPLGPVIDIGDPTTFGARVATLPDGRFVTTWRAASTAITLAAVVSLCPPGAATCGDGSQHPQCEICDAGRQQ